MAASIQSNVTPEKKRKRPRAARACERCRTKKYRCDELYPCSQCKRHSVDCVYDVADHVRERMFRSGDQLSYDEPAHSPQERRVRSSHRSHPLSAPSGHTTLTANLSAERNSPTSTHSIHANVQPGSNTSQTRTETAVAAAVSEDNVDENDHDVEVSDLNPHTQNVEFHGKTSSIAFLAALQPQSPHAAVRTTSEAHVPEPPQTSLVSLFHNNAFSPEALASSKSDTAALGAERYHFRQAQVFLDGYFQNLHFIHPILDRQSFMTRCEDLWFGRPELQPQSFVALYYSVMSLGALIKIWDEDTFDGLGRLEWSRKFFALTQAAIGGLASMTAIESVQCLFFMAKVSQNELNPSLAYLYLGWATRASFSSGFNRKQILAKESEERANQISRLWWGLYSLEIEVSFALGRPDSLGADAYHNQIMPRLDETETAIIPVMVDFARIIREVSLSIYLAEGSISEKTVLADEIDTRMKAWLHNIPGIIRPAICQTSANRKITKAPTWAKRQRLVLELRFYNVRMVLFRPFVSVAAKYRQGISAEVSAAVEKCVDAARSTVTLMHDMYCNHAFFRTWWYNTTYILYAASIILCYGTMVAKLSERSAYLELGEKAVEILDAMEESTVASNASRTIQRILLSARDKSETDQANENQQNDDAPQAWSGDDGVPQLTHFTDDSLLSFLNFDENLDFLGMTFPLNSSHFPV